MFNCHSPPHDCICLHEFIPGRWWLYLHKVCCASEHVYKHKQILHTHCHWGSVRRNAAKQQLEVYQFLRWSTVLKKKQEKSEQDSITKLISSAPHSSAMLNDRGEDSSKAVATWSNFVPTTRIGMEDSANCSASKSHLYNPSRCNSTNSKQNIDSMHYRMHSVHGATFPQHQSTLGKR